MATFVLHANTPCAGKGNVSTLSGPNHSIAVSVAGVGAVFAQFQVWGREDGGEHGKINGLVTVSGTTSATQTVTFTGRYKEIWLELVGISAASTFSATITTLETEFATNAELDAAVAANGGQSLGPSVSVAGVMWAWNGVRYEPMGISNSDSENALLVIGDSITANNNVYSTNGNNSYNSIASPLGPENWMQYFLGEQAFDKIHFRGYPGIKASSIVNGSVSGWGLSAILASSYAKNVQINLGTNDIDYDRTASQVSSAIIAIADAAAALGRTVSIRLIQPRSSTVGAWTAARQKTQIRANMLISQEAYKKGYGIIDGSSAIVDWANTTAYVSATGMLLADGIHPSNKGACAIGRAQATYYLARGRRKNPISRVSHFLGVSSGDPSSRQLLSNPLFNTITGWTPAASAYGTMTPSFVRTSDEGNALVYDIDTLAAGVDRVALISAAWTETSECWTAGNSLVMSARIKITGYGGSGSPVGVLSPWMAAYSTQFATAWGQTAVFIDTAGSMSEIADTMDGVLRSRPLRFTGSENNKNKTVALGVNALIGARFRVEISNVSLCVLSDDGYREYPWMWTSAAPPAIPSL